MKRILPLVIVCLLLLSFVISCDNGSEKVEEKLNNESSSTFNPGTEEIKSANDILFDMSIFSHLKANISTNTEAIGLQQIQPESTSRGLDSYLDSIIVKQDSGKDAEPIQFEVVNNLDGNNKPIKGFDGKTLNNGEIISQGIIPSKVDKLYVSGDFTFVSYLTVDAMKLFNSVNTKEIRDSNGSLHYEGSENFNIDSSNNGGTSESIWWNYWSNNSSNGEPYIYISYNKNRWWNDSNGYHNESREERDDLTLRSLSDGRQAINERKGVLRYDVNGYYSSYFRKSYIIDNNTGLIYEIPSNLNLSLHRGVAIDSELGPVDLIPKSDGSLEIKPTVKNSSIGIYDVFRDIYGQIFILNDSLDTTEDNIVFYTCVGEYIPTEDGRVLHITYGNASNSFTNNVTSINFVLDGFNESGIHIDDNNSDSIKINYAPYINDYWQNFPNSLRVYNEKNNTMNGYGNINNKGGSTGKVIEIKDGFMYSIGNYYNNSAIGRLNLRTLDYYIINTYSSDYYFTYLDRGNVLIATKDNGSLYSISWKPLENFNISNCNILKSDGTTNWI